MLAPEHFPCMQVVRRSDCRRTYEHAEFSDIQLSLHAGTTPAAWAGASRLYLRCTCRMMPRACRNSCHERTCTHAGMALTVKMATYGLKPNLEKGCSTTSPADTFSSLQWVSIVPAFLALVWRPQCLTHAFCFRCGKGQAAGCLPCLPCPSVSQLLAPGSPCCGFKGACLTCLVTGALTRVRVLAWPLSVLQTPS